MSNPNLQEMDWSSIVFVNGQRFAKEAKLFGVETPFHPKKLNGQELAQMMLAADFVQLAQAGAINLSLSSSKLLFITTITVAVQKLKDMPVGKVNHALLAQITGNSGKDNVKGIVYRMIGKDYADPYGVVAGWAKRALLEQGYYRSEERGAVAQLLAGSKLIAVPETLTALVPLADTVENGLKQFQTQNPDLYKHLLADIQSGLRSRVERDNDPD